MSPVRRNPPAKKAARRASPLPNNGLSSVSLDRSDSRDRKAFQALASERKTFRAFAAGAAATPKRLDPETAARHHLELAFASPSVRKLARPRTETGDSEFKVIATEASPLTGTTVVKFRQTLNKIPVYGSLVVVELDGANNCLAVNSTLGTPAGIPNIARVSPAKALGVAAKEAGRKVGELQQTPRLNFYFDQGASQWHLAYIVEDVPGKRASPNGAPLNDYVVDAIDGMLLATLPRVSTLSVTEVGVDWFGRNRTMRVDRTGTKRSLHDSMLNVTTYDFGFKDLDTQLDQLPGDLFQRPPTPWAVEAVTTHANTCEVTTYLRDVLKRNNIDNMGGTIVSSVNCFDGSEFDSAYQPNEWRNAYWNGEQVVYGQIGFPTGFLPVATMLDIVAHEIFHGVTDATARLEYETQAGALNESYSDIFGVLVANKGKSRAHWEWRIGKGFQGPGSYLRNLKKPSDYEQPQHMRDFVPSQAPFDEDNDWGGVHSNSGIHNYAAYRIMVSKRSGTYIFKPSELAALFYLALTLYLSRTSGFLDSRRAVISAARSLFRNSSETSRNRKIAAIERAFSAAGIK